MHYVTIILVSSSKTVIKINTIWSSHRGAAEMNLTRNHEVTGSIPGLVQWVKGVAMGCGSQRRLGLRLLWLCCRPAVVAPIGPLGWEPPYAAGLGPEKTKKGQKKKKLIP